MFKKCFIISLAVVSNIVCQPVKIYLNTLTKLDDESIHLVTLSSQAKEQLVLPKFASNETLFSKKYLDLFYSWDSENDEKISILLFQLKNEDLLYVDKNNDNDLSNDGDPILFPLNKDSITIDIISPKDINQKLKLALYRKPDLTDSLKASFIDPEGNLSSSFLKFAKIYSDDFNFEGKKRSFYFDYRITLRRGELNLGSSTYSVGLFDYSNNGRFNDKRDLILMDFNKTGKLNLDNPSNVFSIDDVFTIDNKNYKLTEVDKYGQYFIIEETKNKPTFHYLKWIQEESSKGQIKETLREDFWNNKLVSLSGEEISLSTFKGQYLFLNIWGEWCQPCINEIEELKQAYEKNNGKVVFLGALKVNDLTKAKRLIQEKNISWPNTFITNEIIKEFNIISYPTNILIFPDGINYIKEHGINRTYFDMNVK
ncbi:MAG: TlpA family protein disulfide reductase [Melioribacteraceae bacterium]|nr:TlpA family protein disulfide reductase [Melioribacteraceae bacterium]